MGRCVKVSSAQTATLWQCAWNCCATFFVSVHAPRNKTSSFGDEIGCRNCPAIMPQWSQKFVRRLLSSAMKTIARSYDKTYFSSRQMCGQVYWSVEKYLKILKFLFICCCTRWIVSPSDWRLIWLTVTTGPITSLEHVERFICSSIFIVWMIEKKEDELHRHTTPTSSDFIVATSFFSSSQCIRADNLVTRLAEIQSMPFLGGSRHL